MKKEEIIKLVQEYNPRSLWDLGDIQGLEELVVAREICVDKHRWYETSINVYKCDDGLLGVGLPSNVYSESNSYEDLEVEPSFCEMVEEQTITYKIKQN